MELTFNNVKSKALNNKKQILKIISNVLDNGICFNGFYVKKFEKMFKEYLSIKYFNSCASGNDSLILALKSLELNSNDEVIFPVNSYPTVFPIYLAGLRGVPVDVDKNGQMDPESLLKFITEKTKVVIVVHLYGQIGRMEEIINICKKNKIILIEDCAQAFGSQYKNKLVGTLGDFGCFSFYPTKNLGTLGDGGGIVTKKKKYFEYIKKAVQYGEKNRYESKFISGHSRLPEIQAAILCLYLYSIKKEILKRRSLYNYYYKNILKMNLSNYIRIIKSDDNSDPAPHLLVIKSRNRNQLKRFLETQNIKTFIHYPFTIDEISAFDNMKFNNFPEATKMSKEILSLPFHPDLTKKQINYILDKINKFYNKRNEKN
jgi:dTDP-4-amino-4,6-dideoxygalactose transaminase